jgi:hypothetical protein
VTGLLVFVGYFFTTKAGGVGHGARNRSVDCRSARGHDRSGKRRWRWSAVFFEAKRTGNVAAQYLSNTVLLTAVLFFAGTSAKFDQRYVRQSSLFFAVAAFLFAAVRMLMLPVA